MSVSEFTASEELYRLLAESISGYAIIVLNVDGQIIGWNAGATKIFRSTFEESIGSSCSWLLPADGPCSLDNLLATAGRSNGAEVECRLLRSDGAEFQARLLVDAIQRNGELRGYGLVVRDITEAYRAQEDLRCSEENFRLLLESVESFAIVMLDPRGRIKSWSLGAERIKRYRAEDILGEHFSIFYSPEDRSRGDPDQNLLVASEQGKLQVEGWRYRGDGSRFWAWVVIAAIHDDGGQLIGFAKLTRDMTAELGEAEAFTKAREQVFHAEKLESIGQITGGVAHDFNNLLQIITNDINLAFNRIEDAKVIRLLSNAQMAADRGFMVTRRLLAFARQQSLNFQEVSLHDLLDGMFGLVSSALGPSISIRREVSRNLPTVHIDGHQLEIALLNLFLNSKDAMLEGGELEIGGKNEILADGNKFELPPGNYVCLSVSDEGCGMDPEILRRAVDPFFTTKGAGKGTGLGLSMVKGFIEQSGGRLILKSEAAIGTTVELWMVAARQIGEEQTDLKSEIFDEGSERLTILNVDDDVLVRLNTSAILEDMGHCVIEASSGDDAIQCFAKGKVDLVVTDQAMPKMSGLQLVEKLREIEDHLPVIIATGYAELDECNMPRITLLKKPFFEYELKDAIFDALKISKRQN